MKKYFYLCLGISTVGAFVMSFGFSSAKEIFIGIGALLVLGPFIWLATRRPIEKNEKKESRSGEIVIKVISIGFGANEMLLVPLNNNKRAARVYYEENEWHVERFEDGISIQDMSRPVFSMAIDQAVEEAVKYIMGDGGFEKYRWASLNNGFVTIR